MRRLVKMTVILILLAACGQGGGAPDDGDTQGEGSATSTSVAAEPDGEETLADFFGYGSDDPEEQEAQWRDEEARRQELIRACMAEEGFDYTPVQQPEDSFTSFGPGDEEEWARTQGFGITTWYGNEDQFSGPEVEWEDPNQEMVDAMSESEREAYYAALWGTEEEQMEDAKTEIDPETGEEITYYEGFGAGCEGKASEEIWGDQSETGDLWEELSPEMEAMYERVQADPRIAELDQEWSECMADAGYEYESRNKMHETIFQDFHARFDEIVGPNGGYVDPMEGWTEEEMEAFFEEKTEDEINAFFEEAQQQTRDDIDQEALAALQQEEIDLAVADFECGADYWDVYQEVSTEYEADFIAANRDILEKIREAQGG